MLRLVGCTWKYRGVIYSDAFHGISCYAIASMSYTRSHEEADGVLQFLWAKPSTITCDDCMRLFARRGLEICHAIIQYESDAPHSTYQAQVLQSFHWELLHHPPCCSDPAPSDPCYRCGLLKQHKYHSNENVEMVCF